MEHSQCGKSPGNPVFGYCRCTDTEEQPKCAKAGCCFCRAAEDSKKPIGQNLKKIPMN